MRVPSRSIRRLAPLALVAGLAVLPATAGAATSSAAAPRCTRAAVKAGLGPTVRTVNSVACQGRFAAGSATTTNKAGGFDFNYVMRARGARWIRSSCTVKGLPARLHKIACTSS